MKKLFLVAVAACTALLVSSCDVFEPVESKAAYFAEKWVNAESSTKQQVEAEIEEYRGNLKVKDYELFNQVFESKRDSLLKLKAKKKLDEIVDTVEGAFDETVKTIEALIK